MTNVETAALTRESLGRRTTGRQIKEQQRAYVHEEEIADGHIDTRYAGFVVVSAPGDDRAVLEGEVERVSMQASRCRLRVERLYGQQASALTFGLPLARGLR